MNSASTIKPYEIPQNKNGQDKNSNLNKKRTASPTLQGVLLNKSREDGNYEPNSSLLITTPTELPSSLGMNNESVKSFDIKKALTPLLVGTVALFGAAAGLSLLLKHSAKTILKTTPLEQLPPLAYNMNIKQEPHFAAYMMLRSPNMKTIKAALGVFAMSGITLISKNFIDGIKQIWIKKRESDIQRDLQENLIETETKVFSGKLQIERNILSETAQYFDKIFNKTGQEMPAIHKISSTFKSISNFCGKNPGKNAENKKNGLVYGSLLGITAVLGFILGKHTFKNLIKASQIADQYTAKFTEDSIDFINKASQGNKTDDLTKVEKLFEVICAKPEFVKDTLNKMNVPEEEIQKVISNVEKTKKSIYADAPETYAGITEKIQYYCYLDEDRGHLYNALMNPDNKFTKYLFMAFSSISAVGYMANQCVEAIKNVAVSKENANTELSLQNRLIDVELKNFQSKKNSAVNPLLEEFNKRLKEETPEEDLKNMADNILMEIKNGAPFVYS